MSIAVVADAHIGGPGGDADELVSQLRRLPQQGCTRLILLGDLFHVWVGDRRYETPDIACVVEVLRELRRDGLRIDYIEGNRDFFLDGSPYADAFDGLHQELIIEQGGQRCWFVHGDGINDRDWRYRFWRWLSKSQASRFFFHRLPGPLARRLVHSTEARLARSSFRHKTEVPLAPLCQFARSRLGVEADVLVLGHFHDHLSLEVLGGHVCVVEAWFVQRQMQWLDSCCDAWSESQTDADDRRGFRPGGLATDD